MGDTGGNKSALTFTRVRLESKETKDQPYKRSNWMGEDTQKKKKKRMLPNWQLKNGETLKKNNEQRQPGERNVAFHIS